MSVRMKHYVIKSVWTLTEATTVTVTVDIWWVTRLVQVMFFYDPILLEHYISIQILMSVIVLTLSVIKSVWTPMAVITVIVTVATLSVKTIQLVKVCLHSNSFNYTIIIMIYNLTVMTTSMPLPVLEITVGVVIGVIAVVLILLIAAYLVCRRKKNEVAR